MSYTYKYARPAITADCIVFARNENDLMVLLIQRAQAPFQGQWAFPGGFADAGESLDDTASRELREETGLKDIPLQQLYTFSRPDRDPREHVITVAYYAIINQQAHPIRASSDACNAAWFSVDNLPTLAFDHAEILNVALKALQKDS